MSNARRANKIATPYRGMFRIFIIYFVAFFIFWLFRWIPSHTDVVETCRSAIIDQEFFKKYPLQPDASLETYIKCRPLTEGAPWKTDKICLPLRKREDIENSYLRAPNSDEILSCYKSQFFDSVTVSVAGWFFGLPLVGLLAIIGWRLLKQMSYAAIAILMWVLAGFEKYTER